MHLRTSSFLYSQLANLVNSPVNLAWALALRPSTTSPMRRNAVANRPLLEWIVISPFPLSVGLMEEDFLPVQQGAAWLLTPPLRPPRDGHVLRSSNAVSPPPDKIPSLRKTLKVSESPPTCTKGGATRQSDQACIALRRE